MNLWIHCTLRYENKSKYQGDVEEWEAWIPAELAVLGKKLRRTFLDNGNTADNTVYVVVEAQTETQPSSALIGASDEIFYSWKSHD